MMARWPRNQLTPLHTFPKHQLCDLCWGKSPLHFLTTQHPSTPQLRKERILGSDPNLPFCKKFSESSFRFSPSSWSSTNLRMTANSAWTTEKEHHLGVREARRDGGHHPGRASPRSLLEPILPLRPEDPWSSQEHSTRDMVTLLVPSPSSPLKMHPG